ncbi:7712_t:CDS:2 [Acaulospora colombiana]|uniref:7712_t:CDS:1 n=1 Tax=Acaulospora colombiana TaxID=27376 RepID=A0ACA9KUM5_9GLOM|nr:7712_t:CDS:2 [Acaulospora colombiana]
MKVVTTGRLNVAFANLKITRFEFESTNYTEYVPRLRFSEFSNSPNVLINEYGVPQKTMRFLEIGEGLDLMQEVFAYTIDYPNSGPQEALRILSSQNLNQNMAHMVNHSLGMLNSPKNDIKNDTSNFSGAPPTPNANDLQTSSTTPVRTPTPIHTPTPTPKSTPSPLAVNGAIGSPHHKLHTKSPAIGGGNSY